MPVHTNVIPLIDETIDMTAKVSSDGGLSPNIIQALSYVITTSSLIPPWWSKARDQQLHRVTKQSGHLSGLFYLATTKLSNIPLVFRAKDPTIISHVEEAERFTQQMYYVSEFGEGLRTSMKKFIYDYLVYDNGAFIEIIGAGDPAGPIEGRPLAVRHLDSQRCMRTGDPIYPIRYEGEDGKWYKFHFTRVIFMSQQPSGLARMNGVGFSAASRCFEIAQVLSDQLQYKLEKMGARPQSQIVAAKGMEAQQVIKSFMIAEELMNQLGLQRYAKQVVLAGPEIDIKKIDLNNFEPFDEQVGTLMAIYSLAYIIGLDVRDIWPVTGAKASDQIANMKARGRLPADFTADFKQQGDYKICPPYLEIHFDFQDDDEDMQRANIRDIRSRRVERLAQGDAIDDEGQRRMLLEDRDITREEFIRLQYANGKLENGIPVATLFYTTDPLIRALCTIEGFETPTVFADNDPEQIKTAIQLSLVSVYELLARTSSISQRRKAESALAALEWLEGEYNMMLMIQAREALAEERVPSEPGDDESDESEDAEESGDGTAQDADESAE